MQAPRGDEEDKVSDACAAAARRAQGPEVQPMSDTIWCSKCSVGMRRKPLLA
jgi:hypothetical protein